MKTLKIAYYGIDDRLRSNILKEEKTYLQKDTTVTFDFVQSTLNHSSLCQLIVENKHDLYLVDFTLGDDLAKALSSLYFEIKVKNIQIIALWTKLEYDLLPRYRGETGVQTHFSYAAHDPSSVSDLFISLTKYLRVNSDQSNFFQKKFETKKVIKQPFRLKYLSCEQLSLETDAILTRNNIAQVEMNPFTTFPFKDFRVTDVSQSKINFNYTFKYTFDFLFLDKRLKAIYSSDLKFTPQEYIKSRISEIEDDKNLDENDIKVFLKDFEEILTEKNRRRTAIKKTIDKHNEKSIDDFLRVLIVDGELSKTFQTSKRTIWSYPYKFLLLSSILDKGSIIDAASANIVAIDLPDFKDEGAFRNSAIHRDIKFITETLKEISHTETQIVLFNSPLETEDIYPLFAYDNLVAIKKPYSFETLLSEIRTYAEEHDKKVGHTYFKLDPNVLYPSLFSEASQGYIGLPVHLNYISENEINFDTSHDLPMHSSLNYRAKQTLSFESTIYKKEKSTNGYRYTALIHSLDEEGKKALRRYLHEED